MLLEKILLMVAALAVFSYADGPDTATGSGLFSACEKCKFQNAQEHFDCEFYLGNFTSFRIEPAERMVALIGDSISFVCNARTVSDMDNCTTSCITWRHNNTTFNSSISANNLTLNNIQYSHSGNYCCTANDYTMDCVNLTVTGMLVIVIV